MADLITTPDGIKFKVRVQGNLAKVCHVTKGDDGGEVDGETVAFFRHVKRMGWVDREHNRFHEDHCGLALLVLRDMRTATLERRAMIVRPTS